jgi:taurine transport system substrate-binding protein
LAGFIFPTVEEQLSEKWLGGGSQTFMGGVAKVFLDSGNIDAALDSYAGTVNTAPLMAVKGM